MQDGMDALARGARVVRLDRKFRWPGGRHVAVVLNVAYEGWSDGKAPGILPQFISLMLRSVKSDPFRQVN